ncbi:MAG: AAA family ATPase [Vulcanimicrobiaceae bacterium]
MFVLEFFWLMLRLFGTFAAHVDGRPLNIARPHAGAMIVAYVLLKGGGPVDRLHIVRALWPDDDESEARARLRRRLHALSAEFERVEASRAWLQVTASQVAFSPDACRTCDVVAFEQLIDNGEIDAGLRLYAGDLLPDWDEEWVIVQRERLRSRALEALERACDEKQGAGLYDAAIAYAKRLQQIDPWREQTVRTLMGLYYITGDRTAALYTYDQFARALRDELGVAPMPETQSAYEGIRNTLTVSVDSVPGPAADLPFIGRDVEMRALTDALEQSAAGNGSLILLSGQSGIGKSRLLAEFAAHARASGARVCIGGTSAIEAHPYQAEIAALQSCGPILTAVPVSDASRMVLAPAFPEFAGGDVLPLSSSESTAPEQFYEAFCSIVSALCEVRTLLIVLDDVHCAGPGTISLLQALARTAKGQRALVVAAFRDDDLKRSRPLRNLARKADDEVRVQRVRVGPLQESAVRAITERTIKRGLQDSVAERLFERSGGNPMFLREMLRRLTVDGSFSVGRLAELPPAIGTLLLGGLSDLDARDRDILDVASVLGSGFDADMLGEAAGLPETIAYERLEYFVDRGVLTAVGLRGTGDYQFAHQSIAEALYLDLNDERRVRTHRRVARALIENSQYWQRPPFAQIAYHLERSADIAAGEWYLRAAHQAMSSYAVDDAERFAAISLRASTPEVRFDALLLLDDVARLHGDAHKRLTLLNDLDALARHVSTASAHETVAKRRFDAAAQAADLGAEDSAMEQLQAMPAIDDRRRAFDIARFKARQALRLGRLEQARAYAREAFTLHVSVSASASERAILHALRGEIASLQGNVQEADDELQEAKGIAEAADDPSLLARILRSEQEIRFAQLRFPESVSAGQAVLRIAGTIGDVQLAAEAYARSAPALARLFEVERARAHFARARHFYRKAGNSQGLASIAINEAVFLMHLGRVNEAQTSCDEAYALFGRLRDLRGRAVALLNRTVIDVRRDSLDSALAAAKQALRLSRFIKNTPLEAHALANLGGVERRLGDLPAAVAHLRAAIALHRGLGGQIALVTHLTELTQALIATGAHEEATTACDELVSIVTATLPAAKDPQFALWSVARSLRALGDVDGSRWALERAAATLNERARAIPDEASRNAFLAFAENPAILAAAGEQSWAAIP